MARLYAVRIPDDLLPEQIDCICKHLTKVRVRKIKKFYRMGDKIRSAYAEMLIRYILIKMYHYEDKNIQFEFNEYGKPNLAGEHTMAFNISHSGNWVICGIDQYDLGVDVQEIKNLHLEIAKHFFAEVEYNMLLNEPISTQREDFYRLWTLKESYIKATGQGLSCPLKNIIFKSIRGAIDYYLENNRQSNYRFQLFQLDAAHIAATCTQSVLEDDIIYIDQKELFDSIVGIKGRI